MRIGKNLAIGMMALVMLGVFATALAISGSNPAACAGSWSSCTRAYTDNAQRATAAVTTTAKTGNWSNYSLSVPSCARITNVTLRADFYASANKLAYANISLTGNNGASWGPSHKIGGNSVEQAYYIDATGDLAWTPSMLSTTNFKTRAACYNIAGNSTSSTCYLDWIPVNVTYDDSEDFYVSLIPAWGQVSTNYTNGTMPNTSSTVYVNNNGCGYPSVNLSVSGCPYGVTCDVSPSTGVATYNATLSITADANATAGWYGINVTGTSTSDSSTTTYWLEVT